MKWNVFDAEGNFLGIVDSESQKGAQEKAEDLYGRNVTVEERSATLHGHLKD